MSIHAQVSCLPDSMTYSVIVTRNSQTLVSAVTVTTNMQILQISAFLGTCIEIQSIKEMGRFCKYQWLTVLSALHASSRVMCTLWRWLGLLRSACREMPVEAASLITATSLLPFWNWSFSWMFTCTALKCHCLSFSAWECNTVSACRAVQHCLHFSLVHCECVRSSECMAEHDSHQCVYDCAFQCQHYQLVCY